MGPAPSPAEGAQSTESINGLRGLPREIAAGFVLAGIGVALTGATWAWNYFGFRIFTDGFTPFIQISIALALAELVTLGIGLFLVFSGLLRRLPQTRPWSRIGPLLILIGTLVVVAISVTNAVIEFSGTSTPSGSALAMVFLVLLALDVGGYIATSLGLLLSLFAVARSVLARHPPLGVPQP